MSEGRDGFIPARKAELIAALRAENALLPDDDSRFAALCQLLAAVLHFEAYEALEQLQTLYGPLDPDAPASRRDTEASSYTAFETAFLTALQHGNYVEIAPDSVVSAKATRELTGLSVKCSTAGIRAIRFFGRGARTVQAPRRRWLGLKRDAIETEAFSEVIVLVAFKSMSEATQTDRAAFARARGGARPGATLVKHFRNMARAELLTLHPGARPTMAPRDQVMLAAPALIGGVPVALQIGPAVTVLFTVIALYFGAHSAIDNSELQRALAAASGLIAVGAFVMRQWMKYERQSLKYQKRFADMVYFRNMANNSGVLDALIVSGEEQSIKEAILAYWALLSAGKPLTTAEIDQRIESVLKQRLALSVDFEILDGLTRLERLGLTAREGEGWRAKPIAEALSALDAAWDGYFAYSGAARASA